jgi:hypothetical protein
VKTRVRTYDSEQVWRQRVEAWRSSGLNQKLFCEQNHLALSTFSLWRQRLSDHPTPRGTNQAQRTQPVSACLEVVPVPMVRAVVSAPPPVVVVVGGRYRLELGDGFQEKTLHQVLQVLEARI